MQYILHQIAIIGHMLSSSVAYGHASEISTSSSMHQNSLQAEVKTLVNAQVQSRP